MTEFTTREDYDDRIIRNAVYFTSVVFLGRGRYDRREYQTQKEAVVGAREQLAELGTRKGSMVYAVDGQGHDALVTTVRPTK